MDEMEVAGRAVLLTLNMAEYLAERIIFSLHLIASSVVIPDNFLNQIC